MGATRSARAWGAATAAAVALLLAAGTGCQQPNPTITPIADTQTPLPPHVELPPGFYPLAGQYNIDNPEDHYHGWPRHIVCDADNMIMTYVPEQTLMMGGGPGLDEVPARTVVVPHFYMDLHEVTNVQFDRFRKAAEGKGGQLKKYRSIDRPWVESEAYHTYFYEWHDRSGHKQMMYPETAMNYWLWEGQTPADIDHYLDYWSPGLNNNHPVRNVSWWEAWYYTKWTNKMLPTEAQWEAAARGEDRRIYPWGNEIQLEVTRFLCNARTGLDDYDGYEFTAPVLSYAAGISPFGIYNMAGNVWEWCLDWYDPGRYAWPSEEDPPTELDRGPKAFGDRNYPNPLHKGIRESRVGPIRGDQRVLRGGSFADPVDLCRVDVRSSARPDAHEHNVGFRCVLPLVPPELLAEFENPCPRPPCDG